MAEAVEVMEARLKDAGGFDPSAVRDEVVAVVKAGFSIATGGRGSGARGPLGSDRFLGAGPRGVTRRGGSGGQPTCPPSVGEIELGATAGGGAEALSEEVTGRIWFRRDWLDEHGLDPTHCAVIGVAGESMEPVLPEGCSILLDRAHTDWRTGRIFVIRTSDGWSSNVPARTIMATPPWSARTRPGIRPAAR